MDIPLIQSKSELRGTCYVEFLPGPFTGKHWSEESVFIGEEEIYWLIAPIFKDRLSAKFNYHGPTEISKSEWISIIADLEVLKELLTKRDEGGLKRPPWSH